MKSNDIKRNMLKNAAILVGLNQRIHETYRHKSVGAKQLDDWKGACREFGCRYDALAFPGGYDSLFERMLSGNRDAIESALCFLECRPYFFRSGYMWTRIFRKIKRAAMTEVQKRRLQQVVDIRLRWRAMRYKV